VPRLVYREAARRDIAEITAFIEQENQDRAIAEASSTNLPDIVSISLSFPVS
jgi:plasmid stabilization system protein ParE